MAHSLVDLRIPTTPRGSISSESAERQSFWNDFFACFAVSRRSVARYEFLAKRDSTGNHGFIDLLYPAQMAVEHKSRGEDLDAAMGQVKDYLASLTDAEFPWLLVACDFGRFRWENLLDGTSGEFALAELADHLDLFWWIGGYHGPRERVEDHEDVNLRATRLLAEVHDRLRRNGYRDHSLRVWMVRTLFCLFADDTWIWERNSFHTYLVEHTAPDGSDLGRVMHHIFEVLNTSPSERPAGLESSLAELTYINGDLFAEPLTIAPTDRDVREALLRACSFNWSAISPAIFGSTFQEVMQPEERRQLGAHYTSEENILRTIRPLFVDPLRSELAAATTKPRLRALLDKLKSLTFFDPACGCGNFLVVAYREIRQIETEALRRLRDLLAVEGQLILDVSLECQVRVSQFHGVEIEEFPAQIARTAMYLMDHICNREVSSEFGQVVVRFPIPSSPHIQVRNALRTDWQTDVLPADDCDYLFGNPPFIGRGYRTAEQAADMRLAFANASGHGVLDYVAAWYIKSADYISGSTNRATRVAFVSTNSLSQGENVSTLWPMLFAKGMHIDFAYRTFKWLNEARGLAAVHCVIIGMSHGAKASAVPLFQERRTGPDTPSVLERSDVKNISPYLVEGPDIVVTKRRKPLVPTASTAIYGSMPNDGGGLLIDPASLTEEMRERIALDFKLINLRRADHGKPPYTPFYPEGIDEVMADPIAARFVRRLLGGEELVNSIERWCLWLEAAPPGEVAKSPVLQRRIERVREHRALSDRDATRRLAITPSLFAERRQPTGRYLAIPRSTSGERRYLPIAFLDADIVATEQLITIDGASNDDFGLLSSQMFNTWLRTVGGRLKSDYRVSVSVVYNNFPFPDLEQASTSQLARFREATEAVLTARESFPGETLASLYGANTMPPALAVAHAKLDRAVDAFFGRHQHDGDSSRFKVLLARYVELVEQDALTFATPAKRPSRRRSSPTP
ncbi:MAG: DNA methyltransferase [Acidimicrobiales bacterium]